MAKARITITVEPEVLEAAQAMAAEAHRSLSNFIEVEILRRDAVRKGAAPVPAPVAPAPPARELAEATAL